MNILEDQQQAIYSNNQCKRAFLINQINDMLQTKDIYLNILKDFKNIVKDINEIQTKQNNVNIKPEKIKQTINNLVDFIKATTAQYSSDRINRNLVKYIEIAQEQHRLPYIQMMKTYSQYIKRKQTNINDRQNQLQLIQNLKHNKLSQQCNHNQKNQRDQNYQKHKVKELIKLLPKDLWKQSTERTIETFDFNQKVLEVVKNDMVRLRLRKKKLQKKLSTNQNTLIIQVNSVNQVSQENSENNQNIPFQQILKNNHNQELNANQSDYSTKTQRNSNMMNSLSLKPELKNSIIMKKNQISAFQKIILVYQKQKYLNDQLQHKIRELKNKMENKRKLNCLLKDKKSEIQKEIEKLQWNAVCDQSLLNSLDKVKRNRKIHMQKVEELSILQRTDLRPYDQLSVEYSQFSINQSMIN